MGPVAPFIEAFKRRDITVSIDEARGPMGMHKHAHIEAIMRLPSVTTQWRGCYGRMPSEADVNTVFECYLPLQMHSLDRHTALIPGVLEAVVAMRSRGLKIGTTTGYTRPMMEVVAAAAKKQGYEPDVILCASDVPAGRPEPWMCFENACRLRVYPTEAMIKIGDTVMDVYEGLNAGMWTVGVAKTGNEMGLSEQEIEALSEEDRSARLGQARERLYMAGAHYVVDSLIDVLPVIDDINKRLRCDGRGW
jgi:phosphonoacetaldehyde hydrolase